MILFYILVTLFFVLPAKAQLSTVQRAEVLASNIIENGGFENGAGGWTASGGSFSVSTTTPGMGSRKGLWNSSSAAQTLTSKAITIPQGLLGRNAVVGCFVKVTSGTATHTMQAFDGTNNVASASITSSTSIYALSTINFVAPSSGTLAVRLTSVASDEPEISVDNCFISDASLVNLSQVNQATFVGDIKWDGVASCSWSSSSSSFANFAADTDCNNPTVRGDAVAPGTKIPAIVLNNLPPGRYMFVSQGQIITSASGGVCGYRFSDGTNSFGSGTIYGVSTQMMTPATLSAIVEYTTAQSSVTINWQIRAEVGTCNLANDVANREVSIAVYRFPLNSEIAYRPEIENSNGFIKYAATANCIWTSTNTSFASFAADADCPTPTTGGSVSAPATKIPGITLPQGLKAGEYLIIARGAFAKGVANEVANFRITDGTNNSSSQQVYYEGTTQVNVPVLNFRYSLTSALAAGSTIQIQSQAGTGVTTSIRVTSVDFEMQIIPLSPSISSPILVGSVTSNSIGAERIERATISNNGSSCIIDSQTGAWLSSVTRNGLGDCTLNIATGVFSAAPTCMITGKDGGTAMLGLEASATPTATSFRYLTLNSTTGGAINGSSRVICMGPR